MHRCENRKCERGWQVILNLRRREIVTEMPAALPVGTACAAFALMSQRQNEVRHGHERMGYGLHDPQ